MRHGNWKVTLGLALVALLVLSAGWSVPAWSRPDDYELIGTWRVTVTQANCSTGAIMGKFQSILTFADGGTMAEDTTNPAFAPGQRGAGQGVWQYSGHRTYTARSIAFINFDTPTPPSGPTPIPFFKRGTQTIAQTIVFNGSPNEWTSNATVQFDDSTGTPYSPSPAPACVTAVGERF
jgi:hypothetical protein